MGILDQLGGGAPSFKFLQFGDTVTGKILSAQLRQKTKFGTGEPETWADGKPMQQIQIVLATGLRDPQDDLDKGERAVYVKAWGDQVRAFRAAVAAAGASDIEVGGTLTVTYTGNGTTKTGQPPKIYSYVYAKPAGPLTQATPPPAEPAAAPAPAQPDPAVAAAFQGLSPEQIQQFAAMAAAQGQPAG